LAVNVGGFAMKNLWKVFVIVLGLSVLIQPTAARGQFFMMENPLVGKEAPDFSLMTLSGKKVNAKEYRNGQKAVVFFWATWCPHCRRELKTLSKEKAAIEAKGIKVLVVDIGETANQVRSYVNKNKIQYDVFLDQDSLVAEKYAVVGVPTFYLLNAQGHVVAVEHALPVDYESILNQK
jgi:peroxiredoxin